MSRFLLWLGPLWAWVLDGVWYDRPRQCQCGRTSHVMRRSLLGTEGCTTCTPAERPGVRRDHF